MAESDRASGSLSGLTEKEAKEFHGIFMLSFIIFTLVAIAAHFFVWQWRPWLPGVNGYSMIDGPAIGHHVAQIFTNFLA